MQPVNPAPPARLSGEAGSGCAGAPPNEAAVMVIGGLDDVATTPSSHPTAETSSAAPPRIVRVFATKNVGKISPLKYEVPRGHPPIETGVRRVSSRS